MEPLLDKTNGWSKVKGKSTTLKNMASVTVTKLPNGVVKISGRKMAGKGNPSRLSDKTEGYMVYPGGYRFWSLAEANKEAKTESRDEGSARIEGVYSQKLISRWREGKRVESNPRRKARKR